MITSSKNCGDNSLSHCCVSKREAMCNCPHPHLLFCLQTTYPCVVTAAFSFLGAKPPGELQVPSPPKPKPAGEAVPDAGLQAGLLCGFGSRRATPTHPRPAAGYRANHEERTHGPSQWRQQPKQPCYPAHVGQSWQWGKKKKSCEIEIERALDVPGSKVKSQPKISAKIDLGHHFRWVCNAPRRISCQQNRFLATFSSLRFISPPRRWDLLFEIVSNQGRWITVGSLWWKVHVQNTSGATLACGRAVHLHAEQLIIQIKWGRHWSLPVFDLFINNFRHAVLWGERTLSKRESSLTTDACSSRHSASKHGRQELFQYWISFSTAPPRFLLLKNGFNVDTSEIWDSIWMPWVCPGEHWNHCFLLVSNGWSYWWPD